ncbi:MAG TPA: F0F1 ATP synthase subunit gamma [Acidimicrobiales bacterium]|nr:F0F1 ATP synthase subunit gamma [Acidimicrobiales bacterium]
MAGGQERVLRRRIKSVESSKKITRAMELIAASRIHKAQQRVAAARPYSEQITAVIRNLASAGAGGGHPLLTPREDVRTVAFVVLAGDRGLAGGFNSGTLRQAENALREQIAQGRDYVLILVGKKARDYFRFRGYTIAASFTGFVDNPSYEHAREVAAEIRSRFDAGEIDRVELVYTQFLSVGTQRVVTRQLMPIEIETVVEAPAGPKADYEYEPEPDGILDNLLPRYAEARLFAALLDSTASFFAAQQRAMKSATDNAEELIRVLSRQMNRARQESITTEILEIVGGAEALAQAATDESDYLIDHTFAQDPFAQHH